MFAYTITARTARPGKAASAPRSAASMAAGSIVRELGWVQGEVVSAGSSSVPGTEAGTADRIDAPSHATVWAQSSSCSRNRSETSSQTAGSAAEEPWYSIRVRTRCGGFGSMNSTPQAQSSAVAIATVRPTRSLRARDARRTRGRSGRGGTLEVGFHPTP